MKNEDIIDIEAAQNRLNIVVDEFAEFLARTKRSLNSALSSLHTLEIENEELRKKNLETEMEQLKEKKCYNCKQMFIPKNNHDVTFIYLSIRKPVSFIQE